MCSVCGLFDFGVFFEASMSIPNKSIAILLFECFSSINFWRHLGGYIYFHFSVHITNVILLTNVCINGRSGFSKPLHSVKKKLDPYSFFF